MRFVRFNVNPGCLADYASKPAVSCLIIDECSFDRRINLGSISIYETANYPVWNKRNSQSSRKILNENFALIASIDEIQIRPEFQSVDITYVETKCCGHKICVPCWIVVAHTLLGFQEKQFSFNEVTWNTRIYTPNGAISKQEMSQHCLMLMLEWDGFV